MSDDPDDAPDCGATHPLANVACQLPRGHQGAHSTITGVRLSWHDPIDTRSR